MSFKSQWTQLFPPSHHPLTESNLPSQSGRVCIVTGGNSGVGLELVQILYSKNATVYMASRSQEKALSAIKAIQARNPTATGRLEYLHLDLNDLATIKASAAAFAERESALHVLWNNAGISAVPAGSETKQGLEQHMGVNCVGPFLFAQLLLPQLRAAAASAPEATVRVIWTSSALVDSMAPVGGVVLQELSSPARDPVRNYAMSKAGNWMLAAEWDRRFSPEGILSLTQNPGNLSTNIWQNTSRVLRILLWPVLYKPRNGAHTMLWAGISSDVKEDGGRYVVPWGRWHPDPRRDIVESLKSKEEGGTGTAQEFWEWCNKQTLQYV
ncbi:MAG: hypothetical protein LQ338_003967 [Usnochroma carphineum]|nr:MAG: hypothetical protein LQ338_003967 [Usnochroma carphineum]